jgi:beta-barrel assembly-enhancing protease
VLLFWKEDHMGMQIERIGLRRIGSVAVRYIALLMLVWVLPGCATMSEAQEIQLGQQVHGQFEQEFGGLYPDAEVQQYVENVGMEMARYAGRPQLPWQFRVLNSEQINAFAVPGGFIYITQGLLYQLDNEAQLAGILGHEAGHIAHRHSVRQIQRAQQAQGLAVLTAIFVGPELGDVAGVVAGLTLMSYGRDQEREADMSGMRYMVQGGYNPHGLVQTMQILQQAGGPGGPEFLSSHPNPANRVQYLEQEITRRYAAPAQAGRTGEEEFQRVVLSRRPMTFRRIEPGEAVGWCMTCRVEIAGEQVSMTEPVE